MGIIGEVEAYRVALVALLGSYDQALSTLPVGTVSRAIVEGAFENTIEMTRRLLK